VTNLLDKVTDPIATDGIAAKNAGDGTGEGKRFASFIATSGISVMVNLTSRWLLSHVMPYEAAVSVAYLFGIITAFMLARMFVFSASDDNWLAQYGRFALVNAFSFLIVLGVSAGMLRLAMPSIGWELHAEEIAHLIGLASPAVLSYFMHKHYSFGEKAKL
jgi:putative flippase GtrA